MAGGARAWGAVALALAALWGAAGALSAEALEHDARLALELAGSTDEEFTAALEANDLLQVEADENAPGLGHGDDMAANASCNSYMLPAGQDVPVAGPESLLRFGATVTLRTVTSGEEGGERVTEQTLLQTHATDKHAGGHGKSSRRNRHSLGAEAGLGAAEGVESGAGTAEAASAAGPSDVPLSCDCAAWSCHCNKDCMCKMRADTFGGERLGPEAALEGIANVSPDFQCTCNPTEVGGPNPSGGGSVDCDCAEAQCRCERRCACRPKA